MLDCPRCGEAVSGAVATEPGFETFQPCGCRVALDGGEKIGPSVDATDRSARSFNADELGKCENGSGGHSIDPETVEIFEKNRYSVRIDANCSRCGSELRGSASALDMIRTWPTAVELEGRR